MTSLPNGLRVETRRLGPGLRGMAAEWDSLLERSTWPTIYSSFDYVDAACSHFRRDEEIFILLFRDAATSGLRAVFPVSVWQDERSAARGRRIEHGVTTHSTDADKPYPIIERGHEEACWRGFRDFLVTTYRSWEVIVYEELLSESYLLRALRELFPAPDYRTEIEPGPESPVVRLDGDWSAFWARHPNLRKKTRRLERRIGDRLSYRVTGDPANMGRCLEEYIATERKAPKSSLVASHREFYSDLLPKLAAKRRVYFGTLYDGERVISCEFSYVFMDRVYFAHGVYDPHYGWLSPGTVSTSLFLRFFHDQQFVEGDFLAGFARYIYPWADRIDRTRNVIIRRATAASTPPRSSRMGRERETK